MTKKEKKLIELLEFHINDKANIASKMMQNQSGLQKKDFYHGQYMAFNEVFSLIKNIKNTL